MFTNHLREAIDAARTDARLVELSGAIWQGHGAGAIDGDEAQKLADIVHARRTALRGPQTASGSDPGRRLGRPSIYPAKRPQPRPDRSRSRERRRRHARARWIPDHLADQFTDGELAVLSIIAEEHAARGACDLAVAKLAALAGVSESTVRNALRAARERALIVIEHRPRPGRPHLTNIVRIVDRAWTAWIARRPASWQRPRGGGGCKRFGATQTKKKNPPLPPHRGHQAEPLQGLPGRGGGKPSRGDSSIPA